MNEAHEDFWFHAKRYGWGWGMPAKWQGWLVLGAYVGLLYSGGAYFKSKQSVSAFLIYAAVVTVALVIVVARKGEKPLAWRWGKK